MTCRYDRATKAHLLDEHQSDCAGVDCIGCLPCKWDQHGNPVRHCRATKRCRSHLGWNEHVCQRCIDQVRTNLARIGDVLALMPAVAVESGRIDSASLVVAGPHADYVTASWALINADRNGEQVEELDMRDPYTCLTMHERMIREDLGHDGTVLVSPTTAEAISYLSWVLPDLARTEEGAASIGALVASIGELKASLELVAALRRVPTRGAPCPTCRESGHVERLERRYALWATHDRLDTWRCPRNPAHEWGQHAYESEIVDRRITG